MKPIRLTRKDFIYKYTTIGDSTLKNLLLSQLWFGPCNSMNDQLEGLVSVVNKDFKPSKKAIENFIKRWRLTELYGDPNYEIQEQGFLNFYMNHWFRNERNRFGISCFSSRSLNSLMWAHYGNKHSGVCLIYSKHILLESLIIKDSNCKCLTVDYVKRPAITLIEKNREIEYFSDIPIVATKDANWRYENEIRFVLEERNEEPFHGRPIDISHSALKGVIYGYQTSEEEKNAISLLIRNEPRYNQILELNVEIDYGTGKMYLIPD